MQLINNIVTLSSAERAITSLCSMHNVDGQTAPEALAVFDEKLANWESHSVIDVVNMRIIEKVRNSLAALTHVAPLMPLVLKPYADSPQHCH